MGNIWSSNQDSQAAAEIKALKKQLAELRENRVPMPWRIVEDNFFSEQKKQELKEFINDLEFPENCPNINLLMAGNVGSGKSSFANTLVTVLRDNTKIANPVAVYGIDIHTGTRKLHEITLKTFENGNKIRLYDCRGNNPWLDRNFEKDLQYVIDGHVMNDYEFKRGQCIDDQNKKYRENPSISDEMHCVLLVAKATAVQCTPNMEKMKEYLSGKKPLD